MLSVRQRSGDAACLPLIGLSMTLGQGARPAVCLMEPLVSCSFSERAVGLGSSALLVLSTLAGVEQVELASALAVAGWGAGHGPCLCSWRLALGVV